MLPFIRGDRDSVVLKAPDDIRIFDIVLAKIDASYVLHRVLETDGSNVILMGDGNVMGTERCRVADIIAMADKIVRDGKEIDCRSAAHLRKVVMWRRLRPLRRYLLAIYKRIIL